MRDSQNGQRMSTGRHIDRYLVIFFSQGIDAGQDHRLSDTWSGIQEQLHHPVFRSSNDFQPKWWISAIHLMNPPGDIAAIQILLNATGFENRLHSQCSIQGGLETIDLRYDGLLSTAGTQSSNGAR